jgi:peroxiredoxin
VGKPLLFGCVLTIAFAKLGNAAEPRPPARKPVMEFSLKDSAGQVRTAAEWKGRKAVVLIFLGTECPVSNGYAPEMSRLAQQFGPRGVLFWGVHPDADVTQREAATHARDYRLAFPVLLDPDQRLALAVGVRVVPEVAVLTAGGEVLYRGRIDDRYELDGKRREVARTRNLQAALTAVLKGQKVPVAETAAFGCPLPRVPEKK